MKRAKSAICVIMMMFVISACAGRTSNDSEVLMREQEEIPGEAEESIAETHGVSSAQVILRWDLQRGIVVIPGSGNPDHIKENLDLFGFELTEDEMEQISLLDRGEKHDWY